MRNSRRKAINKKRKNKIKTIIIELITIIAIIVSIYAYATNKSKYESDYQTATIAKWSFKVNGQAETIGNINLADTRKPNDKVAEGTIAPGTEGQFDLVIDGSGSEVTIEYTIAIDVEEKPQNLKFYTDSEYKNEITDTNNLMNLIDVIEQENVETPVTKTIYWKWPLETGKNEEEINKNDQIDSEDSQKNVKMNVSVTGIQKNPDEIRLAQTTIELLNPKEGVYSKGETIEIQANFNRPIYAGVSKEQITNKTAPIMTIKIGNGTEKTLTFAEVTNNENGESSIKYTYTLTEEDEGDLELINYTGTVYSEKGTPLTVTKKDLNKKITVKKELKQTTIEVVNPKESAYSRGETIEIQANFNKQIYAGTAKEEITAENAPVMKIKIGEGTEKTLTFAKVTNNENGESSIKYTYEVTEEDEGTMQISSYEGTVYSQHGTAVTVTKKNLEREIKIKKFEILLNQITSTNYGDNVDYTVTVNGETLDNWKIFLNDGKNVYLKYGDYLPNSCVTATDLSKYGSYAVYSSSRTSFINALTLKSNWESMLTSSLKAKGATATGTPTLEQYVASWNKKYPSNKLYIKTDSTGYYIGTSENISSYEVDMSSTPGYSDTLYYPYTLLWKNTFGYWLASPSANNPDNAMAVVFNGNVYYSAYNSGVCSICPVICLPSDILAKKDDNTGKWLFDTEVSQTTIEVANPKEELYSKGETITIQANYSEPIYAGKSKEKITAENAPVMKIKIGEGTEKTLTFAEVINNENGESSIKYTYTVEQKDEGILKISDYTGKVYSANGVSLSVAKKDLANEITISNKLVNNIKATNYGDNVDYTVTVNGKTLDNWKIFLNDGKNVYLKYGDYLPNACVTSTLNLSLKTSGSYGVYSTSTANLINELTTSGWGNFLTKDLKVRGAKATGAPTLEQYVESWNGKYPSNKLYTSKDATGYYIGTSENPTTTSKSMSSTTGYSDTLYYPHKASWNSAYGYWLASPSAYGSSYVMDIYNDGAIYRNKYNATQFAACPVICLPSDMIGEKDSSSGKWVLNTELLQTTIDAEESIYSKGQTLVINANFRGAVYAGTAKEEITAQNAPVMKIKIGNGTEKTLTFAGVTNSEETESSIKYTYQTTENDEGVLQITSYEGTVYSEKGAELKVIKKELAKKVEIKELEILLNQITPTNYGENVEYSVTVNGETLDNWKIFLNDGKNVYLRYGDYLPNACVTATDLSKMGSYGVYSSSRDKLINALTTTSNWENMLTSKLKAKGAIATGAPTLEQYVESWNGKYPSNKLYTSKNAKGYYIGTSENPTTTFKSMSGTSGYSDTLYYPHTSSWNSTDGYWLASPSGYPTNTGHAICVYHRGDVGFKFGHSDTDYSAAPVICLPSDILAQKDDNTGKWVLNLY